LGGSRRFCVQCGNELKPDLRFCVRCGHEAASGRGYEAASAMPAPVQDDAAPPALDPGEPTSQSNWPYQPTKTAPALWPDRFAPPPEDAWRQPGRFSPSPGEADYPADPGIRRVGGPPRSSRPAGPPRSSRPAGPPRSRRTLVLAVAVLLVAGLAIGAALYLRGSSHTARTSAGASQTSAAAQGTEPTSTTSPSTGSGAASTGALISERQAATDLAGLLARSVQDRSSIVAAAADVGDCGPTLSQDPQTFQTAAASRQQLLGQLASLPGRSTLPAGLLQSLTGAWQASAAADQDLGKWAQDEVSLGCTQNDQADPNFKAAAGPDDRATTDKKAFVDQWNPIASQYGLTTYRWNQL
jgi:hypothetical protein